MSIFTPITWCLVTNSEVPKQYPLQYETSSSSQLAPIWNAELGVLPEMENTPEVCHSNHHVCNGSNGCHERISDDSTQKRILMEGTASTMDKSIDVQARICFAAIPFQNVVACLKSSETSTKNPQPRTHIKLLLIKSLSCIYQVHHFEQLIQEGTEITRKLLSIWKNMPPSNWIIFSEIRFVENFSKNFSKSCPPVFREFPRPPT